MGDVNQALGVRADLSYGKHTAGIAMETVFFDGNVNIQDVAIFRGLSSGMPWQITWLTDVQQDLGKGGLP